jgi:hypothetical protein
MVFVVVEKARRDRWMGEVHWGLVFYPSDGDRYGMAHACATPAKTPADSLRDLCQWQR